MIAGPFLAVALALALIRYFLPGATSSGVGAGPAYITSVASPAAGYSACHHWWSAGRRGRHLLGVAGRAAGCAGFPPRDGATIAQALLAPCLPRCWDWRCSASSAISNWGSLAARRHGWISAARPTARSCFSRQRCCCSLVDCCSCGCFRWPLAWARVSPAAGAASSRCLPSRRSSARPAATRG